MVKVSEEQIESLVKALEGAEAEGHIQLSRMVDNGESIGFYHGMVSALVLSHMLARSTVNGDQGQAKFARLISIAAALASQHYLSLKQINDLQFPDLIEID